MKQSNNPKFNVLSTVGIVADKLKDSKCNPRNTKAFISAVEKLNAYFNTKEHETWMLCAILSNYYENSGESSSFTNLARFFGCTVLGLMNYRKDFEALLSKCYIRNTKNADESAVGIQNDFELSSELLSCMAANKTLVIQKKDGEESNKIINAIKTIGTVIEDHNYTHYRKYLEAKDIEEKYQTEPFFSEVIKIIPEDILSRFFFYSSCNDLLNGHETSLSVTLQDIYGTGKSFSIARSFMDETNILLKSDLVEFTKKEIVSNSRLEITQKAKEMLLGDDAKLFTKMANGTDVIQPEKIKPKELFYSAENESEIERLISSLQDNNLDFIQKRLVERGFPKGITVLLYGAPGTGKTESVYQIAKKTGRKILHVDISSSKSCWFGESEKIIKMIFTDYKNLCKACKNEKNAKTPILLFNEADGILSKRKDSDYGNITQTENAMQNIILEEMEKLEGIMIATTNLAENLDAAFERRFLFKIKFENPSVEVKMKIWKSKLDWLSDDTIKTFATNYDFSGGQIDNIVRKITMDEVITGNRPNYEELLTLCKNEKLNGAERRIGFY